VISQRDLGQHRDTPNNEKWSGRWESKIPLDHTYVLKS